MTRHILIFAACFLIGAVLTAAVRAVRHDPYPAPAAPMPAPEPAPAAPPSAPPAGHAGHAAAPVNTLCAICGMEVDPRIPTTTWQGKAIGFGCRACPPKFAADPGKYGPAALENRVVEE